MLSFQNETFQYEDLLPHFYRPFGNIKKSDKEKLKDHDCIITLTSAIQLETDTWKP